MARLGLGFTAPALEWHVDPGVWPAAGERRDGRALGALIVAIGMIWIAVPLQALGGGAPDHGLGTGGLYVSLGIGIALTVWGCGILVRRQTIRIDDDGVAVTLRRVAGTDSWREPLADYRGVVWRSEQICRRGRAQSVHLIDLWHEDPSRTVNLFSSTSDLAVREFWQAWAHGLGLPALRWTGLARGEPRLTRETGRTPVPTT